MGDILRHGSGLERVMDSVRQTAGVSVVLDDWSRYVDDREKCERRQISHNGLFHSERVGRYMLLTVTVALVMIFGVNIAWGSVPSTGAYGEVERFGGFDTGATYSTSGSSPTTGLEETVGEMAKFVYPIGMAVDTKASGAPDEYAIYVLEEVNPQALDPATAHSNQPTSVSLEYRIQKVSDTGKVLASTPFKLTSTTSQPGLHAVSLAVDGPAERVYVLIMDVPPVTGNTEHYDAVDAIDAWTTDLAPTVGLKTGIDDDLVADPNTGAGELVGPSEMQQSGFVGDIDGTSIAVYGSGTTADLALAGNRHISETETEPAVQLIKTAGGEAGKIDGTPWTDRAGTEDAAAKEVGQSSEALYSMSANPDGSLNISLGPKGIGPTSEADYEPNMATIGSSALSPTTALLPSAIVAENKVEPKPRTEEFSNVDAAATMGFSQDIDADGNEAFQPYGGTPYAGSLAPSVVQLAGGGSFPSEVYAGLVVAPETEEHDEQNPEDAPPSWGPGEDEEAGVVRSIVRPSSLALRVFGPTGESLAMIGDTAAGGYCNLQSSPASERFGYTPAGGRSSFVALAAGREGVLFALVQPDLLNTMVSSSEEIAPTLGVGADMGDQVVEFAPGAGDSGAGANASKWQECPQPTGSFSVTNESIVPKEAANTGMGELSVRAGTTLKFDAEEIKGLKGEYVSGVDLRGSSPWAYDWNLEGGVDKLGAGPLFEHPWTVRNTFTDTPEAGKAWMWPSPIVEAEFKTPGTYAETLKLVNDFGTLTTKRALRVIEPGAITNTKIASSANPTEGTPVLLKAFATLPKEDKIRDYHWEFGDGQSEDTGESGEVEHAYAKAGSYTVKLTITDALGQEAKAEEGVTVAVASGGGETTSEEKHETPVTKVEEKHEAPVVKTETPVTKTTPVTKPKSLTTAEKLAKALKACKKDKSKKLRASCEKQAKKKYAPKPKSKKSKKKK